MNFTRASFPTTARMSASLDDPNAGSTGRKIFLQKVVTDRLLIIRNRLGITLFLFPDLKARMFS
jgi:hypothetical protein